MTDTSPARNRIAQFAQRLWLSIVCMRYWQWIVVSLLLGGIAILLYAQRDTLPRNPAARVTPDTFLAELRLGRLPDGKPSVTDVTVYPWNAGVRLVTYKLAVSDGNSIRFFDHFLYEKSAQESPSESVGVTAASAGVPARVVRWVGPPINLMIAWGGGTVLLLGILWPAVLHWLRRKGLGPKIPQPLEVPATVHVPAPPPPVNRPEPDSLPIAASALQTTTGPPPPKPLSSEPLQPAAAVPAEDKEYRGQYYPVEQPHRNTDGFTLVELLVVIGIIGILITLLIPALAGARRAAGQLQCASNLRNIGIGILFYLDQNQGVYPAAYIYVGQQISNGVETPSNSSAGYVHWSTYLYGSTTVTQADSFTCPALDRGGLPPDNTTSGNLDPGQIPGSPGVLDQQVARLAYTLNEAICPRNKFVLGFQGAVRIYQYVKQSQVSDPSETILGTEWGQTAARIDDTSSAGYEVVSHRPITGFIGTDGTQEMYLLDPSTPFRRVTASDLDPDPASGATSATRLDWVGRNHGRLSGYPDERRSNFLYVDGHIEAKSVYETLSPFQWGREFYTLNPHDDLAESKNP